MREPADGFVAYFFVFAAAGKRLGGGRKCGFRRAAMALKFPARLRSLIGGGVLLPVPRSRDLASIRAFAFSPLRYRVCARAPPPFPREHGPRFTFLEGGGALVEVG